MRWIHDRAIQHINAIVLALMGAGAAAAVFGQKELLDSGPALSKGPILMAIGSALFLLALVLKRKELFRGGATGSGQGDAVLGAFPWRRRQWLSVAVGIAGGVGAFVLNGDNEFSSLGVAFWALGALALVLGFWPEPGPPSRKSPRFTWQSVALLSLLVVVTGLASFFRLYDLKDLPREMTGDHAWEILNVRAIRHGLTPVYFVGEGALEPLFHYTAVPATGLAGYTFVALKGLTAAAGIATVPMVYLLAREMFGNKWTALMAAALLAVLFWHVIFSRYGFSAGLTPLAVVGSLLFLFRGVNSSRSRDFLLAGIFTGAGLYTYAAFRLFAVAVGVLLALALASRFITRRHDSSLFLANCVLWLLSVLVIYAPMARYALDNSGGYWDRVETVSAEAQADLGLDGLYIGFRQALFLLNWQGDFWLFPGGPEADYVTAAFYILGLVSALAAWIMGRKSLFGYAMVVFLVLLIPAMYKPAGHPPAAMRAVGAAPLAAVLAAFPLHLAASQAGRLLGRMAPFALLPVAAVVVGFAGYLSYDLCFDDWREFRRLNSNNTSEVAVVIRDFGDSAGSLDNAYLKLWGWWQVGEVLAVEVGDLDWRNWLDDIEEAAHHRSRPGPKLYILNQEDTGSLRRLIELYPQGHVERIQSQVNDRFDFVAFYVPGRR